MQIKPWIYFIFSLEFQHLCYRRQSDNITNTKSTTISTTHECIIVIWPRKKNNEPKQNKIHVNKSNKIQFDCMPFEMTNVIFIILNERSNWSGGIRCHWGRKPSEDVSISYKGKNNGQKSYRQKLIFMLNQYQGDHWDVHTHADGTKRMYDKTPNNFRQHLFSFIAQKELQHHHVFIVQCSHSFVPIHLSQKHEINCEANA